MGAYDNPVSTPWKYKLVPVDEIEWSDGCYEFNTTVVLRSEDGRLCYAEDSGCSCPTPFDGQTEEDLTWVTREELQAHLESRSKSSYSGSREAEIADLMLKVAQL